MLCIFCQEESSHSTSIEHIIPESLGNVDHVLPAGVVCDKCNQYFGSKVEGPLLDSDYFRHARCMSVTPSKKGRVPGARGLHPASRSRIELVRNLDGTTAIYPTSASSMRSWTQYLATHTHGRIYVPSPSPPDEALLSRFLAKVALEVLASQISIDDEAVRFLSTDPQLNSLRVFARYGGARPWPFHRRELYAPDTPFYGEDGEPYEVLHEYALLYTEEKNLYLVCAIYGVEYTINLGGPKIDGYTAWLEKYDGRSYLDLLEPNRASP